MSVKCFGCERLTPRSGFPSGTKLLWGTLCNLCISSLNPYHKYVSKSAPCYSGKWCSYRSFPSKHFCGNPECSLCTYRSFASFDSTSNDILLDEPDIHPHEISKRSSRVCWFRCLNTECGFRFQESLSNMTSKFPQGCPQCVESTKSRIQLFLQKHFPDALGKKEHSLSSFEFFDFFIPSTGWGIVLDTREIPREKHKMNNWFSQDWLSYYQLDFLQKLQTHCIYISIKDFPEESNILSILKSSPESPQLLGIGHSTGILRGVYPKPDVKLEEDYDDEWKDDTDNDDDL